MGSPLQRALTSLREARARDAATFWVKGVLLTLCVACALRLVIGDDPWTGGVAERVADGAHVRSVDYARTWGWWSAAGTLLVLLALLATLPRWLDRRAAPVVDALAPQHASRGVVAWVAAAVLAGAVLGLPRLSQSLFEDEEYNVQWSIDGFWYTDREDKLRFHEPSWSDTLWHYKEPNNHVPHSILARLSVGIGRLVARPDGRMVPEAALRTPAFLAGLGSIAVVALLAVGLGHPGAGVAAAWLLALHPWHLRYLSEARGYTLALLLLSLCPWLLVRCLHCGTWGRWAAYGAAQFLLLWTYPSTLWFVALLNLTAVASVLLLHRNGPALGSQLVRWAIVGLAGALAWGRLMAPNVAQFLDYSRRDSIDRMDRIWFQDVGAFLATGMPWGRPGSNPRHVELSDLALAHPALVGTALAAMLALVLVGVVRWCAAGGFRARLAWVLMLPAPLAIMFGLQSGAPTHPQYLIPVLPALALLWGVGLETLARPLGRRGGAALIVVALALFAAGTQPMRSLLRERPIQPWRESVEATRPTLDPLAPENQRIITVSFYFPPIYYDPLVHRIREPEHLDYWMNEARRSQSELFINIGRPRLAERRHPELMALAREHFEEVETFDGILSRGQRRVFRYRPES